MKHAFLFAFISCALLLGSCADNSLMTDEEYYRTHGPASHSSDYSAALPRPVNPATGRSY